MLRKYYKHYRPQNLKDSWNEQYADIEEYIIRKCNERKINWLTLSWHDKLTLAEEFGCKREMVDSMYNEKFKI
jgi:hypothetical protein